MKSVFGHWWNQLVLVLIWAFSLLFLYAHMDSRLTKYQRDLAQVVAQLSNPYMAHNAKAIKSGDGRVPFASYNEEDLIILYNRVPKTGSTSFMNGVCYALSGQNQFHTIHLNISRNIHTMTLPDQTRFLRNITNWTARKPAIYHGHVAFIDFSKFGHANPVYINIVRDPLERLVSYYYFLRFGDNYRPYLKRKKQRKEAQNVTFDECVEQKLNDCDPKLMWLQIPFFCGHEAECWHAGSRWALQRAKHNLAQHYALVGLTEQIPEFVAVLEAVFPRIFKEAYQKFTGGNKSFLRKTNKKIPPSKSTIETLQASKEWQLENEFYEFARDQFNSIKQRTVRLDSQGQFVGIKGQEFHYEKIKPEF